MKRFRLLAVACLPTLAHEFTHGFMNVGRLILGNITVAAMTNTCPVGPWQHSGKQRCLRPGILIRAARGRFDRPFYLLKAFVANIRSVDPKDQPNRLRLFLEESVQELRNPARLSCRMDVARSVWLASQEMHAYGAPCICQPAFGPQNGWLRPTRFDVCTLCRMLGSCRSRCGWRCPCAGYLTDARSGTTPPIESKFQTAKLDCSLLAAVITFKDTLTLIMHYFLRASLFGFTLSGNPRAAYPIPLTPSVISCIYSIFCIKVFLTP